MVHLSLTALVSHAQVLQFAGQAAQNQKYVCVQVTTINEDNYHLHYLHY